MISLRYRDKENAVHKLNPFVKLAWVAVIFVLSLIFNHPLYLLMLFLSTLPMIIVGRIWREWASIMKFAFFLSLTLIIINTLVSFHGSHVLWQAPFRIPPLGVPTITLEAIVFGAGMSLRLLSIISAFAVFTLTIHPDDIMLMMIKMKLPYKSVLVTSLSTKFIPTLVDDAERISGVQRSRGLELDHGGLRQKIRSRLAIVIPLLSNSLDRTVQIAEAMESRGFGAGFKRTFYKDIRLNRFDIAALALSLLPLVYGMFLRSLGYGDYQYYPALAGINLSGLEGSMLTLLVLLLIMIVPLALLRIRTELD